MAINRCAATLLKNKFCTDPSLPLQLASYMIQIWKRHVGIDAAKLRASPPIIPIVLFHGEAEGTVPASLAAVVETQDEPALAFAEDFNEILQNIRRLTTEDVLRNADLKPGLVVLKREVIELLQPLMHVAPVKGTCSVWRAGNSRHRGQHRVPPEPRA